MRADLLALSPEAVAALSNMGLVKRAQREIEQGKGPKLTEESDGTVVGVFEDGVTARLPPGRALRDCTCSCTAAGVCRHRVGVALAYKTFAQSSGPTPTADGTSEAPSAPPTPSFEPWSPGTIDDAAIERTIGKRALEEAKNAEKRGVIVEVVRPTSSGDTPIARLPSCTVRFLVPNDLAYARCDCVTGQACMHVAIAAWAFRVADVLDRAQPLASRTVEVKRGDAAKADVGDADAAALTLVEEILIAGVTNAREALAQRFVLAREPLEKAGFVWPASALDDLEASLERYRARSSRYRARDVLSLAGELVARGRSARAAFSELPAAHVLGRGEARETKLDHLRLVGLGCRFDADDRERSVEVLFADPDTGTVLVIDKSWMFDVAEAIPDAPDLARRRLGPGSIAQLARGQVVTRAAKRRANRALTISSTGHGSSSVTPQTGDLSILPAPLRVERLEDLEALLASRAPRFVRPRVRAEDIHVIPIASIEDVAFDAAEQALVARLRLPSEEELLLRRAHRRVAPRALDEIGRTLLGKRGTVRWVVGNVTREGHGLVIDPTMIVADDVVVPDVEDAPETELPRGQAKRPPDRVAERLDQGISALEEIAQLGLHGLSTTYDARLHAAIAALDEVGAKGISDRLKRAREAVATARRAPSDASAKAAVRAVIDAAIRLEIAAEARVG